MWNHQTLSLFSFTLLLLLSSALSAKHCHPDDEKALYRIMKAFNNTGIFSGWPDPNHSDCCTWDNIVICDEKTHRVTGLYVDDDNEVAGPMPDAVGDLPYLESVRFHKLPKVTGPLPKALTRLKNLKSHWITYTKISGPVPDFLSRLTKLEYINLSINDLTGPIPPSLSKLRNLGALFLDRNRLTGSIPESFDEFKNNPDFYLRLAKNQLFGPIPKSLGAINFTELLLFRNKLSGDASFLFGANKGLQRVDLSRNQLSFDMTHLGLPKSLNELDLSHNMIFGSLPRVLVKLPNFQLFNVSYNRLCGPIPTGGDGLKPFDQYSYVHNKCLCGSPLPPCNMQIL